LPPPDNFLPRRAASADAVPGSLILLSMAGAMDKSIVSVPLTREMRSGVSDMVHRGWVVVVDDTGKRLLALGTGEPKAYIRSAAKPMQCLPVILSGAANAFGLDDKDIAIICGSHVGGAEQVAQVRSILSKAGLTEQDLQSGSGVADECSGKHSGMLVACKHLGYPTANYAAPDHPHQQAILKVIREVCRIEGLVHIGVDGCSAPIHYLRVADMALGFARMSVPERHFDDATAAAIRRITRAMWLAPKGHTGEPGYAAVLGAEPALLTKAGGGGVYCAGIVGRGIGFAMKVEHGSPLPLVPVFLRTLEMLGLLPAGREQEIMQQFCPPVKNRRGQLVGKIEVVAH